jgi:hypothetical protein
VRSLRSCDWRRQGGYIHLHNLFFCRQALAKPSFRICFFVRHSGEGPCTCRHSGKTGKYGESWRNRGKISHSINTSYPKLNRYTCGATWFSSRPEHSIGFPVSLRFTPKHLKGFAGDSGNSVKKRKKIPIFLVFFDVEGRKIPVSRNHN